MRRFGDVKVLAFSTRTVELGTSKNSQDGYFWIASSYCITALANIRILSIQLFIFKK
jgi:hypothetical protein